MFSFSRLYYARLFPHFANVLHANFRLLLCVTWGAHWRHLANTIEPSLVELLWSLVFSFFMVALCNRAYHYIFALWFLSFFFFSSPNLSGRRCLPYFHTWCGLSANLECMSEMRCTLLAENTGRKKSPFWHHRTTLSGCIFAAEACIDNRKKGR